MDPTTLEEDETEEVVKEMIGGSIPRVDAVRGPASGLRFHVIKAGERQDPEAVATVQKAEVSTKGQNDLPDSAFAYIEPGGKKDADGKTTPRSLRHFPIMDAAHVRNALSRAPQSPFGDKAMPKIRSAATKFGIDTKESSVTKSNEAAAATDPESPELVLKADDVDLTQVLDPTQVEADPETVHANGDSDVPGDANVPGSAAWEALDAATARKWTSILARAKNALGVMGDRELQEVASGNGGDVDAAFDLEDACAAVDYAISILAPFAVDEQSEADSEADCLEDVSKALGSFKVEDLDLIEQLAPVQKAGRVLSAGNEAAIREAVTSLQGVLSSLPAAPVVPEPVTKSEEVPVDPATDPANVEPVTKAKGDDAAPMIACYNADGDLIGVVAEGDLTSVGAGTPADPSTDPAPAPADPEIPDPGTESAQVPVDPTAPAPAAVPVAKAADEQTPDVADPVLDAVTKALEKRDEEHDAVVKSLTERVEHLEAQPAVGGPLLSGVPTGGLMALRGQSGEVNPEFAAVQKALEEATDPQAIADLRRQKQLLVFKAAYSGS